MPNLKKWSIKQVINGLTYFNQSFTSTEDDYLAFRSFLLLPKPNEIITCKLTYYNICLVGDSFAKTYFYKVVPKDNLDSKRVLRFFIGRYFNGLKIVKSYVFNSHSFYPKNIINQGTKYEYFVSDYFKDQGYNIVNNFEKGQKDEGIDIIATKGEELLLIQCKNWQKSIITHSDIKEFLGNCYLFLYKNPQYRKFKKVRRLFVSSQSNLDESAKYLLKDSYPFVEFLNLPYKSS